MILITGDAHSGQRRDAESLLNSFVSAIYIATSRISDNQIAAASGYSSPPPAVT